MRFQYFSKGGAGEISVFLRGEVLVRFQYLSKGGADENNYFPGGGADKI